MKNGAIAGHLMGMRKAGKLVKPSLRIQATMDAPYPGEKRGKYEKEEIARLKSEIAGIQDALTSWDGEDVANRARRSIESELAMKKARLVECKARYANMDQPESEGGKKGKASAKAKAYDEEDEPEEAE